MSGISALGLAVGMASAFLILQYISFEMGYDWFHANHDSIYRVVYDKYENGSPKENSATTFYGVAPWMKTQFQEVEHVIHIYKWPINAGVMLYANNQVYNERNYLFAEPDFFMVFPSLLLKGDASTSWTFIVVPFLLLAALVGLVASVQTHKAASSNPVDHLKDE